MATRLIRELIDDLDGTEAAETLLFSVDGVDFEIDLNEKNAKRFRDFVAEFQEAGTRVGRSGRVPAIKPEPRSVVIEKKSGGSYTKNSGSPAASSGLSKEENRQVRAWANGPGGYEVSDRGRIPDHIIDAWRTQTPNPDKAKAAEKPASGKAAKSVPAADFKAGDREPAKA